MEAILHTLCSVSPIYSFSTLNTHAGKRIPVNIYENKTGVHVTTNRTKVRIFLHYKCCTLQN